MKYTDHQRSKKGQNVMFTSGYFGTSNKRSTLYTENFKESLKEIELKVKNENLTKEYRQLKSNLETSEANAIFFKNKLQKQIQKNIILQENLNQIRINILLFIQKIQQSLRNLDFKINDFSFNQNEMILPQYYNPQNSFDEIQLQQISKLTGNLSQRISQLITKLQQQSGCKKKVNILKEQGILNDIKLSSQDQRKTNHYTLKPYASQTFINHTKSNEQRQKSTKFSQNENGDYLRDYRQQSFTFNQQNLRQLNQLNVSNSFSFNILLNEQPYKNIRN